MIVLDASVLIGVLNPRDAHHRAAIALLEDVSHELWTASVLTVAEVLVRPARSGRENAAADAITELGVEVLPFPASDAVGLARVRARFALKMPDAVVLHAALKAGGALATFDDALAAAARTAGIRALPA